MFDHSTRRGQRQPWQNYVGTGGALLGAALTLAGGVIGAGALVTIGALVFLAGLGLALVLANGVAGVFLALGALALLLGLTAVLGRDSRLGILAIAIFVGAAALGALAAAIASSPPTAG